MPSAYRFDSACTSRSPDQLFRIHPTRAIDAEKHTLVYTVVSTKLINGSPYNSISVVATELH